MVFDYFMSRGKIIKYILKMISYIIKIYFNVFFLFIIQIGIKGIKRTKNYTIVNTCT